MPSAFAVTPHRLDEQRRLVNGSPQPCPKEKTGFSVSRLAWNRMISTTSSGVGVRSADTGG